MNHPTPRPAVAALAPYPLDASASTDSPDSVNLQYNEHWAPLSDSVRAACMEALTTSHLYPETSASPLRAALAVLHDIDANQIVCANGSSELISLLCQIYCDPDDQVVVGPYSYLYFRAATRIVGAHPALAETSGLALNVDSLLDSVTKRTRIVFIDNPHNPIGGYLGKEALQALRERLPDRVLLVIDAAYAEYADAPDYAAGIELVKGSKNCVMLRTFSKIYGLAGLRIGWAYASADVAALIHRVRQPNNLSSVSIAAALASLDEQERVSIAQKENAGRRQALIAALGGHGGFSALPSQANFVLAEVASSLAEDARDLAQRLQQHKILVRPMASYGLPNHVRITIGSDSDQTRLLTALAKL